MGDSKRLMNISGTFLIKDQERDAIKINYGF
jgi:hypothetical protein